MRLLFISNSYPFPPRNGLDLVSANLLENFRKSFDVEFLLLNGDGKYPENAEEGFWAIREVPVGMARKIWDELTLKNPLYFSRGSKDEAVGRLQAQSYDWIWCGDVSALGFVRYMRKRGFWRSSHVAAGINEAASVIYAATFREALLGKRKFSIGNISRGFRAPLIRLHEKKYLNEADVIHVQTEKERLRVEQIIQDAHSSLPVVVSAPNGKKSSLELLEYAGGDGSVLYFAQLTGERSKESNWFIRYIWPQIFKKHPGSRLLIVGNGSKEDADHLPMEGVDVLGYVDDIADVYGRASVAVVPTFRGTGLINRIQDAIVAGVPVVSTIEALETIDGLEIGRHALSAGTADEFADKISGLLQDREARLRFSHQARTLAESLPTWEQSANVIMDALLNTARGRIC